MVTRRQRRVSDLIQEEISDLLRRETKDPRLEFVTITAVETSADLRHAHIYISVIGSEDKGQQALAGLKHAAGFLRRQLWARLSLRYIPQLTFYLDESLRQGDRIDQLLQEIEVES